MSDDWDFYSLRVDDQPAFISVDLGLKTDAPIRSHPSMAYLRVFMRRPTKDGLSSQDEFEELIAIEDGATTEVAKDGTAIFVGRNTSSGNRDFYFYVADPVKFEGAAHAAMQKFPDYKYETGSHEDREWRTYFEFLYPSTTDLQRIMNRRVLQQLEKRGDNPENERKIDHLVFLPSARAQSAFVGYIRAEGFSVESASEYPNDEGRFHVEFSRSDRPAEIQDVVIPLFEKAVGLGGDYDGWGCEVSP